MYKFLPNRLQNNSVKMVKNKRDLSRTSTSAKRRSLLTRLPRKPAGLASGNIKVVIRVRPPNEREMADNYRTVVKVINNQMLVFDPEEDDQPFYYHGIKQRGRDLLKRPNKNMQFNFDTVFGVNATNDEVFTDTTSQLIDKLMEGCNCSVFVYGATGAGKTFTMLGNQNSPGITLLTMKSLFEKVAELSHEKDFELGVTYLEVYNEIVQDLLNPGQILQLREDGKFGIVVSGIKIQKIDSADELFVLLEQGNKNRTQHPTDANAESSRSHAVFQVYLKMTHKLSQRISFAKLSMIDLAGSERGAATGCVGQRFTEGANINKSLLALGNCINSLADGRSHIPYRDSKLTRLLKDSLGGNCQTVMIANISPSSMVFEDTYNTLKYATRAKKIKTCIKKNVVNVDMNVEEYMRTIEELKMENVKLLKRIKELENNTSTQQVHPNDNCIINFEAKNELLELFAERTKVQTKMHELLIDEQVLNLKKKYKEDADARLSDLCPNTPDKTRGHKRLLGAVNRIEKQSNNIKEEISMLEEKKNKIIQRIEVIIESDPNLKHFSDVEETKLNQLNTKFDLNVYKKLNENLCEDSTTLWELMTKMSSTLRMFYLQMKGRSTLPASLEKEYKSIVQEFQGVKSVRWDDNVDMENVAPNDYIRKRKINELGSTCSLNATYVQPQQPTAACTETLLKASSSKPPKKVRLSPKAEDKKKRVMPVNSAAMRRLQISKSTVKSDFTNGKATFHRK